MAGFFGGNRARQARRLLNTRGTIYSVTELVARIRDVLETGFANIILEGEIGSFTVPRSGHYYFSLKDANAQIQAVMFRMQNRLLRFTPEDGMVVMVRGRVSCYPPRGTLQIIIDYMEPKGAGALAAAFEQRKLELAARGYFDPERKKSLPELPWTIGIVTSPTGAALYDALHIALTRNPHLHVLIAPTLVQGDTAPDNIADAIAHLVDDGRSEIILLIRGGGSAEDLWAFNELQVAEAIFHCPIPIVAGIGHEVDFTIADFCADVRAATPTAAAETAVPRIAEILQNVALFEHRLLKAYANSVARPKERFRHLAHRLITRGVPVRLPAQRLDELSGRISRAFDDVRRDHQRKVDRLAERLASSMQGRGKNARAELESLRQRLHRVQPEKLHRDQKRTLDRTQLRLNRSMAHYLARTRQHLDRTTALVQAFSPFEILGRGYSIVRKTDDGSLVRQANQVRLDESLDLILARGELGVSVRKIKKETLRSKHLESTGGPSTQGKRS